VLKKAKYVGHNRHGRDYKIVKRDV